MLEWHCAVYIQFQVKHLAKCCFFVVVIVVKTLPVEAAASPHGNHDWRHASRGQRVGGCYPAESGQPTCCENGLGDDSIGYLVDVQVIGQPDSWVSCALERPLATWRCNRRESCGDGWLTLRSMADQWTQLSRHSKWTSAIWFAAAASDISYGMSRGLWNWHRGESKFRLHTLIWMALKPDKYGFLWSVKDANPYRCD